MKAEVKKLWVDALRSGKYKQGIGELVSIEGKEHCCLGVLCDLYAKGVLHSTFIKAEDQLRHAGGYEYPSEDVVVWAGLDSDNPGVNGNDLAALNDEGKSFEAIANLIEKHL